MPIVIQNARWTIDQWITISPAHDMPKREFENARNYPKRAVDIASPCVLGIGVKLDCKTMCIFDFYALLSLHSQQRALHSWRWTCLFLASSHALLASSPAFVVSALPCWHPAPFHYSNNVPLLTCCIIGFLCFALCVSWFLGSGILPPRDSIHGVVGSSGRINVCLNNTIK